MPIQCETIVGIAPPFGSVSQFVQHIERSSRRQAIVGIAKLIINWGSNPQGWLENEARYVLPARRRARCYCLLRMAKSYTLKEGDNMARLGFVKA
jgi:hypothetical protein